MIHVGVLIYLTCVDRDMGSMCIVQECLTGEDEACYAINARVCGVHMMMCVHT